MSKLNEMLNEQLKEKITNLYDAYSLLYEVQKQEGAKMSKPYLTDDGMEWYMAFSGIIYTNKSNFNNEIYLAIRIYKIEGKLTVELPHTNEFNFLSLNF